MKVAVTGGSGHLGAAVCRTLLENGHQVRALVHRDSRALDGLSLEQVSGSVQDSASLQRLMEGVEAVQHLAGLISIGGIPGNVLEGINVTGTQHVVDACRRSGVRRLVHFSSVHAYVPPPHHRIFDESAKLAGESDFPYSRSKAKAQQLVLNAGGLETIVLNPTSVLGPWDYKPSLQGQMMLDFAMGRIPMLPPGGFDWVDNRDLAVAAVNALTMGRPGHAYLLSGRYADVPEIAALVAAIAGRKPPTFSAPMWLLRGALPFLSVWSRLRSEPPLYTAESLAHLREGHPNICSDKAARDLGFRARPLEETIKDTMQWFTENATKNDA